MNPFLVTAIVIAYLTVGGVAGLIKSKQVAARPYVSREDFYRTPLGALVSILVAWPVVAFIFIYFTTFDFIADNIEKASRSYTRWLRKSNPSPSKGSRKGVR